MIRERSVANPVSSAQVPGSQLPLHYSVDFVAMQFQATNDDDNDDNDDNDLPTIACCIGAYAPGDLPLNCIP